ncbi:type VI secretion system Vgr family protein [Caballeronia sp. BR00000012568055]|uniref:type VI secretion system Vgr family protein n=1 Tax=Caballeronia sp. BR00000012568055 TaxID=2918761 RepID=UPI0023F7715E|nr:type VI secretion system tip protein TssI/VgrG [Caballeronia sp. BR00000012568055]
MAPAAMSIDTPLGQDLLFHTLRGTVELGRLTRYDVLLLSPRGDIELRDVLGKHVTVHIALSGGGERLMPGYIVAFRQEGLRGRLHQYRACIRPWLWFLTRRTNCRIFQSMTVQDIVKAIFADPMYQSLERGEVLWQADARTHPVREYCVQYRESDFHFISRLLEDEGIYYWFAQRDGVEKLIFSDGPAAHEPVPGYERLPYRESPTGVPYMEYVTQWRTHYAVETRNFVLTDYDFEHPTASLLSRNVKEMPGFTDFADLEQFDFPGGYVLPADGESLARIRGDEFDSDAEADGGAPDWHGIDALTNARGVQTGALFTLAEHPRDDLNSQYLITRACFEIDYADYESFDAPHETRFEVRISAIDATRAFAPARITRKAVVRGPQTAVVVGPKSDEIYTDPYGRVKVQFFWDRVGQSDENSSCWIRVSHPWAGAKWGMVAIPRIGQEVIVDFLEGDPDKPVIVGRLYNADNMPPFELPANMTQWGVKSRSTTGGAVGHCNELSFEDAKGHERLVIHAERDHSLEVEASETHSVGADRSKTIGNDETASVKRDRTATVGRNETTTVKGTRTETVTGDESLTFQASRSKSITNDDTTSIGGNHHETITGNDIVAVSGDRSVAVTGFKRETVSKSKEETVTQGKQLKVGADYDINVEGTHHVTVKGDRIETVSGAHGVTVGGAQTVKVSGDQTIGVAQTITVTAGTSLKLVCGKSAIEMDSAGNITINGENITSKGSKSHTIKGMSVTSSATAKNTVEGTVLMLNP